MVSVGTSEGTGGGLLAFGGKFRRSLDHFVQQPFELSQPRRGNNDGIAPSIHVLGNPQKTAAVILLERKHKGLPLNLNLVRFQRLFRNARFGRRRIGTMAVRRWTLV